MIENLAAGAEGFTSNGYLLDGERVVLVDPGSAFGVVAAIHERTDDLDAVVLAHTHPDHVGNVDAVRDAFDAPVLGFDPGHEAVDAAIEDDQSIGMGEEAYRVLHTPGHATDHLCLYAADSGICFAGDLVFRGGSFGRTDFPGADWATLIESIDRLLDAVDADLEVVYPGHGPAVVDDPCGQIELARRFAGTR